MLYGFKAVSKCITSRYELKLPPTKKLRHEFESNIANNQLDQAISDHEETISHCPHCDSHELGTDYIENYLSWFRSMEDNTEFSDQTWIKKAL